MIITAALQANCAVLYSEDLQHGQQIESLTIVNPFLAA
jgi:predicted nucleic acid-binding protein